MACSPLSVILGGMLASWMAAGMAISDPAVCFFLRYACKVFVDAPGWDDFASVHIDVGARVTMVKTNSFFRSDAMAALVLVIAVAVLHFSTDTINTLERRFYDFASTSTSRQPSSQIAVIAIDDQSIANIGRWPWSRDVHAKVIDQLAQAKAKTIVHTAFFFEPQVDRGLSFIRQMKEVLQTVDAAPEPTEPTEKQAKLSLVIAKAESELDTDGQLASSFKAAGNVIVPSVYVLGQPQGNPDVALPDFALSSSVDEKQGFSLPANKGQWPLASLGKVAAGVGHLNQIQDVDGAVRQEPLLVNYFDHAVPSMALLAALNSLNLTTQDIKLESDKSIKIGRLRIKTDASALMRPQFYPGKEGKPAFAVDSFYDVLTGKIPAAKYAGKVVVIGATAAGVGTQFPVPGNPALSPAETIAHITSSILQEHFIVQPAWGTWAGPLVLCLVSLYLILALPKLTAGAAAGVTSGIFLALLSAEFGLLSSQAVWMPLVFPATLLLLGHLALTTKRFLFTEAGKIRSDEESAETNRMMGLSLQGQGQLDMAFDRFRRVPLGPDVMENLYNLALDFERKRQFNKAQTVYEHMASFNAGFKDLKVKLNRAKNLSETVMLGGGSAHPGGTLLLTEGAVEKPMLGRYQVEKELGKGAMGVVYLGKDPKIGRVVAIKTLALSSEFEGDELVDARERFFREAETAGRLQHQHIVTIFDAGEEHDLAYIAMEFLKGKDLSEFTKVGHLLAVPQVLSIVARVAQALAYAHSQHVVHRDIKPANIMYELATDTVKVTDFGIARITDSSKTKTGLVLGTPSFMSPEQLAGKRVDGRSDLYSLGVMLFQLLTGVLPFRGESMTELMYKIANEEAPDLRVVRPELSVDLAAVVQRALVKNPQLRYTDGEAFARDLYAVLANLASGQTMMPPKPTVPPKSIVPTTGQVTTNPQVFEKTQTVAATMSATGASFQKTDILEPAAGFAQKSKAATPDL